MKVPCKTEWCQYWVWPKSKTWLCEKCYRKWFRKELVKRKQWTTMTWKNCQWNCECWATYDCYTTWCHKCDKENRTGGNWLPI